MTLLTPSNWIKPETWQKPARRLVTAVFLIPVAGCLHGPASKPKAFDPCPLLAEIQWEEGDAHVVSEKLVKSMDMITQLEEDERCNELSG
ncbi:hypothetical protein ACQU0X_24200 [Pseudovibrio ascidiaceicola]|uniref:hypothetical protein n=1 Tax=Pseudovibrio ascidiaceicola TaxID=285279 RepID=UPI003D362433